MPPGFYRQLTAWHWMVRHRLKAAYEPDLAMLPRFVKAGDWVVDCGANMGQYTYPLSQLVGASGKVIALEPMPETFAVLQKIIRKHRVALQPVAASNRNGEVFLEIVEDDAGIPNSGLSHVSNEPNRRGHSVEAIRLDELLKQRPHPVSFIKCDVEGHEQCVLEGARNLIESDKPVLLVETSPSLLPRLESLLIPMGYQTRQLHKGSRLGSPGKDALKFNNYWFVPGPLLTLS